MRRLTGATLLLALAFIVGCADDAETAQDGGVEKKCTNGLKPMGLACVPIFSECKVDEVPMLGGDCKRVGPPTKCLPGWEKVPGGWCEPILPKAKCPLGTMEKIGYATCQPVGDCGSGTWGSIKTSASTIYVDQGHTGTGGKGTIAEPYKTIMEALNQATAGDHLAVAAGTYNEDISILRKVTLEGRCAQKVIIVGSSAWFAVEMKSWATGAVLRGVTITGAGPGLGVDGVDVKAERIVVQGCAVGGIQVANGGVLTIHDSLVAANRMFGVDLYKAKATLERTVVRDTLERASDNRFGAGIQASASSKGTSELVVRDSLVAANRHLGISLSSSKATVERTVIRDTREQASDKKGGGGIQAAVETGLTIPSELVVRDCVLARNKYIGIVLFSSKATIVPSALTGPPPGEHYFLP